MFLYSTVNSRSPGPELGMEGVGTAMGMPILLLPLFSLLPLPPLLPLERKGKKQREQMYSGQPTEETVGITCAHSWYAHVPFRILHRNLSVTGTEVKALQNHYTIYIVLFKIRLEDFTLIKNVKIDIACRRHDSTEPGTNRTHCGRYSTSRVSTKH